MTEQRIKREKAYHNKAFSEGVRKDADKYYAIHKISFNQLLEKMFVFCRDKKVLEYGCGPGSQSFLLAKYAQEVTAIDISDYAITEAQKKAAQEHYENLKFLEMNAEVLDFPDNSFDMVYGNAIIHHLDLSVAFSEIKRVLKPGGKAFFYEPLGHNFLINFYRKLTPRMRTIDEKPLLFKDIKLLNKYFENPTICYVHLTTLLSVPLRKMNAYEKVLRFFHKTDDLIFKIFPFMKRYAWYCVIEVSK